MGEEREKGRVGEEVEPRVRLPPPPHKVVQHTLRRLQAGGEVAEGLHHRTAHPGGEEGLHGGVGGGEVEQLAQCHVAVAEQPALDGQLTVELRGRGGGGMGEEGWEGCGVGSWGWG